MGSDCDSSHQIEKKVHDIIYVRFLNYVDVFYNRESLLGLKQTIST